MSDEVTTRVGELESEVKALQGRIDELNRQLAEARLDEWKGRIDELELQAHLASMTANEKIGPLIDQLRNAWLDAREQISKAGNQAGDAFGSLREGAQQAFDDLRAGLRDAASNARS